MVFIRGTQISYGTYFMSSLLASGSLRWFLDFWKICGLLVFMLMYFFGCRLFLLRVQDSPYINLVGVDRKYGIVLIHHYCATERTSLIFNVCVSSFFQLQCPVIMFSLSAFQKSGRHMTSPNFSVPLVSWIDFMGK
jgi:hypothetical protein